MKTITEKNDILAELKKYEESLFEFEYLKDGYIMYYMTNSMNYLNIVLKVKEDQAYENFITGKEMARLVDNNSRLNFVGNIFLSPIK